MSLRTQPGRTGCPPASLEESPQFRAVTQVRGIFLSRKGLAVSDFDLPRPDPETGDAPQGEPKSAPAAVESQPQQPAPPRVTLQIDDSKVVASYANFCRVTGTPEEVIIDFGLNPQPIGIPSQPIVVSQRIVMNFYTAKRMLHALQLTIQRHEATFGVLETDIQKRVRAMPPMPPRTNQ